MNRPGDAFVSLGMLAVMAAMAYGVFVTAHRGRLWATVLIGLAGISSLVVWSRWLTRKRVHQYLGEMEAREPAPAEEVPVPLRIQGSPRKNLRLPIALTLLFVIPAVSTAFSEIPEFFAVILLLSTPVLAIAWLVALFRIRRRIATLDHDGIHLPGSTILWTTVAQLELRQEPHGDQHVLVIILREPVPPQGWWQRLNSALSHGAADHEVRVSLRRASLEPKLVFDTAEALWRRAVGDSRADSAELARIAKMVAAITPFRDLPRAEQLRQTRVIAWIFVVMGLSVHGATADFLGAAAWLPVSAAISALLTGLGAYWVATRRGLQSLERASLTLGYAGGFLLVLVTIWAATWLVLCRSLPDMYTRVAGSPREFTTELRKERADSKCRNPLVGDLFAGRMPSRYCAGDGEYAALPASGAMRVKGRGSWFGLHIDRIEPVDRSFH